MRIRIVLHASGDIYRIPILTVEHVECHGSGAKTASVRRNIEIILVILTREIVLVEPKLVVDDGFWTGCLFRGNALGFRFGLHISLPFQAGIRQLFQIRF